MMNFFQSRPVRYILTGGLAFAIELAVLLTLVSSFGIYRTTAVSISFWISIGVAFLLQKFLAFEDRRRKNKIILRQALIYGALVAFNYLFTIVVVALFPDKYLVFSRTLAIIIVSAWNYYIYKNFIFSRDNKKTNTVLSMTELIQVETYKKLFRKHIVPHKKSIFFFVGCSLVVILFFSQYITTGNKTQMGDFDYYSQLYEAFRTSVLGYGQFPAWDPWLSGGIPLWQNPQFGLVSIQSLLVLPFGTIIGMKIAYIVYALAGFWGLYTLSRVSFKASKIRSALLAFIWVSSGFFAGHGIGHFTFTSFFLLPWLIYFIIERNRIRLSWLWLGITMSIIALSSVHYATIFTPVIIIAYVFLSLVNVGRSKNNNLLLGITLRLKDLYFFLKTIGVVVVLAGWQFIATYSFVSNNQRLVVDGGEEYLTPIGVFKALFLPVDKSIVSMPKVTWGWGEYSMYMGFATLIVVCIILFHVAKKIFEKKKIPLTQPRWALIGLIIGVMGMLLALGDFSSLSPFHLLHSLPGFTQTRVPSRWMIYTIFAFLILIASWKGQPKIINALLVLSVIELFVTFGPIGANNKNWVGLPATSFSSKFTQHDNNFMHTQRPDDPLSYYWYTTRMNVGQIHADDSIVNTLSSTPLLETSRCAQNTDPSCNFIRSNNATLQMWSPNKIVVKRTGKGNISIDLNVDAGWRVNGQYIYAQNKKINPKYKFILYGNADIYTLEYAPKFSPSWVTWRLSKIL